MVKILRYFLKGICALLLYWLAGILLWSSIGVVRGVFQTPQIWIGLGSFVAGFFLFSRFRLPRFYVFGHEMTHLFVAKLFLKDTGKIRLGKSKGSVEVVDPNIWITLAPYFLPFYVLLFWLIWCVCSLFWSPFPPEVYWGSACVTGLAWGYHVALTVSVLKTDQTDIATYGPFLSYGLILVGNIFCLLTGALCLTHRWMQFCSCLKELILMQWRLLMKIIDLVAE